MTDIEASVPLMAVYNGRYGRPSPVLTTVLLGRWINGEEAGNGECAVTAVDTATDVAGSSRSRERGLSLQGSGGRVVNRNGLVEAVLAAVNEPGVRLILLTGEAGVGKSFVLDSVAERLGADRVWGVAALAEVPGAALAHLVRPTGSHAEMVSELLDHAGKRLAVDDIDLCDALSRALLSRLLREPDRRVVATVRTTGGVFPPAAQALIAEVPTRLLSVGAFTRDETIEVAQALLGGPVEAALADELWQRTEGNALYLSQMIEAARATGAIAARGHGWFRAETLPVPESLREVLAARLDRLSESAAQAAQWLAGIARVPLSRVEDTGRADAVRELLAAGIVTVEGDELRFRHPLLADAVWERTDALHRRQVLREHFEAERASKVSDPVRMAALGLEVGAEVDARLLLNAAWAASVGDDMTVVARFAQAAIGGLTGESKVEAVSLYANALIEQGRTDEAVALMRAVLERTPLGMEAVIFAAIFYEVLVWYAGDQPLAAAMLAEQARRYSRWTPLMRQIFGLVEADGLNYTGKPAEALALLDRVSGRNGLNPLVSLSGLSRLAAPVRARIAEIRSQALIQLGRTEDAYRIFESPDVAENLTELEELVPTWRGTHQMLLCNALRESGRIPAALDAGMRSWEVSRGTGFFTQRAWAALNVAAVWWQAGDLDQALRWASRALSAAETCHLVVCERLALGMVIALLAVQGAQADPAQRERFEQIKEGRGFLWHYLAAASAWQSHADGRRVEAARILAEGIAVAEGDGALTAVAFLQHERLRMGESGGIADALAELPQGAPLMTARLAMARGVEAGWVAQLVLAADTFEAGGMPLWAAEAAALAAQHATGREQAALRHRVAALIEPIGSPRTPLLVSEPEAQTLTRREREIAELATRYQNTEIAARLHLSVRTVESHLAHAYVKLGITSRQELSAALR